MTLLVMNLAMRFSGFFFLEDITSLQALVCQRFSSCDKIFRFIDILIINVIKHVSSVHRIFCVNIIWPLYERDNTGLKPVLHTKPFTACIVDIVPGCYL